MRSYNVSIDAGGRKRRELGCQLKVEELNDYLLKWESESASAPLELLLI